MAKKALLIGVSQYEAGLPSLVAAPKDVAAMLRVLQSPELGAFDDVKTLIDPDLEAMQTAIDLLFQSCQKGDLGLLYFSGHGITDDSDRLYLATRRTSKDTFRSTAVSASFIHGIMRDRSYQRQHVLILDCCYSGAFAEGWLAKSVDINLKPQLEVEGSVVLTSSTSTQKSYEDKEGELSLYTNYIVQGIESGAAESDGDGMISADELHEYAKRHVQLAKPAMKPEIYGIRQGIKIRLAKARVDEKLEYRRLVERYVENGEISFVGQDILEVQRERWGLSDEVATAIENEVLEPVRKRLINLERYEKSLERACKQQFPLTEKICVQLKDLQEVLGLRDEDISVIQDRVVAPYVELKKQQELNTEKHHLVALEKIDSSPQKTHPRTKLKSQLNQQETLPFNVFLAGSNNLWKIILVNILIAVGLFLWQSFKTSTDKSSQTSANRCPEVPEGSLALQDVKRISLNGQEQAVSDTIRYQSNLGYSFDAKSGQNFTYRTRENICVWLYAPSTKMLSIRELTGKELTENGIYTVQVSVPSGTTTFTLFMKLISTPPKELRGV